MKNFKVRILYKNVNMARVEEDRHANAKRGYLKKSLKVDLTPMVDLGFLLITFFVLTTALSQPTIAKLIMPKDSKDKTPIKETDLLTIVLTSNDSIAWCEGSLQKSHAMNYCRFNNLRSVIQQKQKKVSYTSGNASATTMVIFPGKETSYRNFINMLNEIQINSITHYFVMKSR